MTLQSGSGPRRRNKSKSLGQETLGSLVTNLRKDRRMSRAVLLLRYHQELERINPDYDEGEIRSEAWLARVERNEVFVSSFTLELLCRTLDCNDSERVRLLKCADRIPLITPAGETTVAADLLTFAMVCLHNETRVRGMISTLMQDRRVFTLQKSEVYEIIADVIALVKSKVSEPEKPRRSSAKSQNSKS